MQTAAPAVHPVYALVGASRFLRNQALSQLLTALTDETDALGPARFDGVRAVLAEVLDEVRTPSLLGDRRVVIVDEADPFIKENRSRLEAYASSPSDTGTLILLCNTLPRSTRLGKIIEKTGAVVRCDVPKGAALLTWIVSRARTVYGKRLNQMGARLLRDHVGDELGSLDAELSKLTAYVGSRDEIVADDVDTVTGCHRSQKVFAVTDALSACDATEALKCWEQVLATDRAAPGRAIGGLAWGVGRLLGARRDFEAGVNVRALAGGMYMDPETLRRRLERVTVEELEGQQHDLLAVDLAVKTGAATIERAVERFIVKHTISPAGRG